MGDSLSRVLASADRLARIAGILREKIQDRGKDRDGASTAMLAGILHDLGIANYCRNRDVSDFRRTLGETAELRCEILRRFDAGEPIEGSLASMLSYDQLFDAVAAGNVDGALELARLIGGRDSVESRFDTEFDRALGFALKYAVLGDYAECARWTWRLLADIKRHPDPVALDLRAYALMFQQLASGPDPGECAAVFEDLLAGHRRQSKRNGVFAGLNDEVLCVMGIAMRNLLAGAGVTVEVGDELMPDELTIPFCPNRK